MEEQYQYWQNGSGLWGFDPAQALKQLREQHVAVVDVIHPHLRRDLHEVAMQQQFVAAMQYTKLGGVRQNFAATGELSEDNLLTWYNKALERHLRAHFKFLLEDVFEGELTFNQAILHHYKPTDVGLGPHRDYERDRNLVAISLLGGHGTFCMYDNHAGEGERRIESRPGHVILIRAPGFDGTDIRPFHGVINISSTRTIMTHRSHGPSAPAPKR